MSFGKNKSKSSSKPSVWSGVEPYLTGGDNAYAGPTDRFRPMEVNPQWSDWNQRIGQGYFAGPPPAMGMYNGQPGYGNVGGETWEGNQAWGDQMAQYQNPQQQEQLPLLSGDPWGNRALQWRYDSLKQPNQSGNGYSLTGWGGRS